MTVGTIEAGRSLSSSASMNIEAIAKMQSALGEVIIDGIDTNIDYQYEILKDEDYQSGNFDTGFLASHIIAGVKINEN